MRVVALFLVVLVAAVSAQSTCSQWTACYACTTAASGNCGWCANTGLCAQGTANGPASGSCIAWDWLSNECPATPPPTVAPTPVPTPVSDNCDLYTDCHSCTTQPQLGNCGWCQTSPGVHKCKDGTSTGPVNGTCVSWDWTQNLCPAVPVTPVPMPPTPSPDPCTQYETCYSCTAQAVTGNCGWCQTAPGIHKCAIGTSNGPSTGTCVSWDWTYNLCPATPSPFEMKGDKKFVGKK